MLKGHGPKRTGPSWIKTLLVLAFIIGYSQRTIQPALSAKILDIHQDTPCDQPGWFPKTFGLKDHSVFFYDGYTYIVSIYLPGENRFAYARSKDWCSWEDLGPILLERVPGSPDEMAIWAPFVFVENGMFFMFFTGVTNQFTQRIMLATTSNPADPLSWRIEGVIFQPNHPQAVWTKGEWADCRDPTVLKIDETYYLYYTGRNHGPDGDYGIVGLATADSLDGPWVDLGEIIVLTPPPLLLLNGIPESSTVYKYQGYYYLFYHDTSIGEEYRISHTPSGPWSGPYPIQPGWAHEIWAYEDGRTYASFLTDYTITISPVAWTINMVPPKPFLCKEITQIFMPVAIK
jgi:hypothetical protein